MNQLGLFAQPKAETLALTPTASPAPRADKKGVAIADTPGGPAAAANLRGLQYRALKREPRNERGLNQHSEVVGQIDPQPRTSAQLAQRHGVTEATIRRDARPAGRRTPTCTICSTPALFSHGNLTLCREHGVPHLQRLANGRYFAEGDAP